MTKSQALYEFFSSFGIDCFPNTAPETAKFPFLTYETTMGNAGDDAVNIACNVFYYTESETAPNAKVEEIANKISLGGKVIHCDDGAIWIQRGQPWCNTITEADRNIKRKQLNISLIFM